MKSTLLPLAMILATATALAGEANPPRRVKFSQAPKASRTDGKVTISFAVSGRTDVEVAVLGAGGKVVRHLAAGVLGAEKAPPAPLRQGLAQEIAWDLRDDFGKPASTAPFKIRVRIGTGVKFGRTVSDSPNMIATVRGMATDKAGNLYVVNQSFGYGSYYCQVFDSSGKYLKTIMPFSADLPREKVGAFSYWDDQRQRFIMKNYSDVYPYYLPLAWKNAKLMMGSTNADNGIFLANGTSVYRFALDGTPWKAKIPYSPLIGRDRNWSGPKALKRNQRGGGRTNMAVSPDGETVYATLAHCKTGKDGKPANPHWLPGTIYRLTFGKDKQLEPWKTLEGGPLSLRTVGPRGNLYLYGAKGLLVLSPEGKKLGTLAIETDGQVAVHAKTGHVYVLSDKKLAYQRYQKTLLKYSGYKNGKILAKLDFGVRKGEGGRMALAFDGKTTAVWIGGAESGSGRVGRSDLTRYEDKGSEFTPTAKVHELDPDALGNHDCIAVDRFTEDVYINDDYSGFYRYNGLTGKGGALSKIDKRFKATDLTVGHDGHLYCRTDRGKRYSGPLERLDRDLKPVPFGATGTHILSPYIYSRYGAGFGEKGIGVSRDGKTYLTFMYGWTKYCTAGFGPDGKALKGNFLKGKVGKSTKAGSYPKELTSAVIGPVPRTNGGVRVDSKGNIYLGVGQLPADYRFPAMFAKDNAYKALLGSVVKFGPEGGAWIRTNPKANAIKEPAGTVPAGAKGLKMEAGHFLLGAKQAYTGIGPFSGTYGTGRASTGKRWCDCRSARFDLDMYDRLYLPNAVENSVRVYDNAGNIVLEFGGYANYDSQYIPAGKKAPAVPTKYIPLGWPIGTGVSEKHIYVCDQLNRSVVRADFTYAATATCTIGGGPAKVTRAKASAAPTPAVKTAVAAPVIPKAPVTSLRTPNSELRTPEKVCNGWLAMARNYRNAGLRSSARTYLQKVIRAYPDTKWAVKARAELGQL